MLKKKFFRPAAWASLAFIIFATISPIGLRPHDPLPIDVDRALAFGLLAALFVVAYPRRFRICCAFILIAAGGLELVQLLSPTRHAHLDDAAIKAVGACGGLMFGWIANQVRALTATSP